MNGVVQRLAQDCKVDAVFRDWRVFNIAQPVFKVFESVFLRQLRPKLNHLWRIIDRTNFARAFRKQLRGWRVGWSLSGDRQRGEQRDQSVCERLPRPARDIASTELASELIEIC